MQAQMVQKGRSSSRHLLSDELPASPSQAVERHGLRKPSQKWFSFLALPLYKLIQVNSNFHPPSIAAPETFSTIEMKSSSSMFEMAENVTGFWDSRGLSCLCSTTGNSRYQPFKIMAGKTQISCTRRWPLGVVRRREKVLLGIDRRGSTCCAHGLGTR